MFVVRTHRALRDAVNAALSSPGITLKPVDHSSKDMQPVRSLLLLGVCSLLILSGCGSSSYSSSRGTIAGTSAGGGSAGGNPTGNPVGGIPGPTGSNNSIVATVSVAGTVSVVAGAKQTVSVTFTSSDGSTISGFGISGSLATLPPGWSGPGAFTCASVSTGSGCVLNLTYAPAVVGSGTLTIDYVFIDNSTMPSTGGSLSIPYAATAHNNVIAAASPTGEINALPGAGSQSVGVSFTTDDANAATNLTLTSDLAALPPGWSSTAASFSCAIVSADSGCLLPLTYAPTAPARGTLTLDYSYTDDSGATRTGALNIPYSTSSQNTVIATASPPGQVDAVEKSGGQAVAITFTTDDGKAASNLYMTTNLAALPIGWSSASQAFSCASVSSGNGCQLHLTYAPATLTRDTLILNYAYTNAAGMAETGSLNVAYAATTNDNAVATASPLGQVTAVAPLGTQAVSVTFTTDDGRPATALQVTSGLSALPAGWSSAATVFSCSGFSSGNGCQLSLTYAPTTAGSGTLILGYTYTNNAGQSKSGSASIAYRATTNNNVTGTPSPISLAVVTGSSTPMSVTFTTDDGNLASGLSVTSGLGTLPSGWSSPSGSFACATVSTGSACQLTLTYAPSAVDSGTLSLTYGYNDDSGTPKSGSVSIPYTTTPAHLYVAELSGPMELSGSLLYCPLNGDGTLSSCTATATDNPSLVAPTGIAFYGSSFAYIADNISSKVFLCSAAVDGSLSGCASTGSNFQNPWQLAVSGSTLYASNASVAGGVTTCSIANDGSLSGCSQSSGGTGTAGIAANSSFAYVGVGTAAVDVCAASLTGCGLTGSGFSNADGIYLSNGYAYVANQDIGGTVGVCAINADGSLAPCANSLVGGTPSDVVINGNLAYVDDSSGNIYLCAVSAGGALGSCAISNGGTAFVSGVQLAIH